MVRRFELVWAHLYLSLKIIFLIFTFQSSHSSFTYLSLAISTRGQDPGYRATLCIYGLLHGQVLSKRSDLGYFWGMKIEWYTNACVRVIALNGASIVCDPWVNGGAFLGSWFHWPPISEEFGNSLLKEPCDGIYISHLVELFFAIFAISYPNKTMSTVGFMRLGKALGVHKATTCGNKNLIRRSEYLVQQHELMMPLTRLHPFHQ